MTEQLVTAIPFLAVLTALAAGLIGRRRPRLGDRASLIGAALTATLAGAVAVRVLVDGEPLVGDWYLIDRAGATFLAVVAVIGLLSAIASVGLPAARRTGLSRSAVPRLSYWVAFHLFWAALLAVTLVDNLGVALLLIEATTAASALLVAYSGRPAALEAAWKYLVLTTFGVAMALFGAVVLYGAVAPGNGTGLAVLDWQRLAVETPEISPQTGLVAFILLFVGLAGKVGWAPIHNWLPDAHSEALPPISALLSAALLPSVALVAWRLVTAFEPGIGTAARALPIAFGLVSLAVAAPFLWRALPWKRLLAYSSLEHMGVLALAIGFGTPLALAGLVLHVGGHALAKGLGFYAAIPLMRRSPDAASTPLAGLAGRSPEISGAVCLSLLALAAVPPSPLFLSELLILAGGIAAGQVVVSGIAAVLLAAGFLGLAHALIEALGGGAGQERWPRGRDERRLVTLTVLAAAGMVGLTIGGFLLPGSEFAADLGVFPPDGLSEARP